MNYQNLRSALSPSQGTVTISPDSLESACRSLLNNCYQSQSIVISDAVLGPEDGSSVVITGRSSFLQMPDLPVKATFSLDESGKARMLLKYQLRDSMPGPAAWTFSRSFPKLPSVMRHSRGIPSEDFSGKQKSYLESLDLFDTQYVVASNAQTDPDYSVPLSEGINFVSRMRPQGMVGVLENAMRGSQPLVVYGAINIPLPTTQTLPLQPFQRPWDRPDVPGIHLQSPLDLDFKLGKLVFDKSAFRVYSPPSTDWQSTNAFPSLHGYTGRLAIPSAGIEVEMSADLQWGLPSAYLFAQCEGISLGKLAQLVDLTGDANLTAALPQELQSAVDKLSKLELMSIGASVTLFNKSVSLSNLSVTVGFPSLVWKIWEDKLQVTDLACRFDIGDPFSGGTASLAATVMGTLLIEGVPFSVMAHSGQNFSVYAALKGGKTIPLGSLLKSYAPSVPAPSDLTINSMAVKVTPGASYSMHMALASQPKPWVISVGSKDITLNGLALDLSYPKGGPMGGAFSGSASLGKDMSLAMKYVLGQGITLRGTFTNISLKDIVNDLCNRKGDLPAGFDLSIASAVVLVSQQKQNLAFQMVTELSGIGTMALEVRKLASGQSGFATGLSLTAATLSKLQGLGPLSALEKFVKLQKLLIVLSSFEDNTFTFPDMAAFNQPTLATKSVVLPAGSGGVRSGLNVMAEWTLDSGNKQENLLKSLLSLDGTQQVVIQVGNNPANDSRLMVTRRAKIQGKPFECKFGVQLEGGKPSLFLTGSLQVEIQKQLQTFDVTTAFVPGGAFLSATMKGKTAIDCKMFKLSNVGLEIGVNWAGIPSLGITATIDVKEFQSSVAMFFDSTDPSKSLVAGSVSDLTLKEVVDTLLGSQVKSSIDDILKSVAVRGTQQFKIPVALAEDLNNLNVDKVSAAFSTYGKLTIPSASTQVLLVVSKPGETWHLTDLTKMRHYQLKKEGQDIVASVEAQFYFAPQATSIGSIAFPQGFYLNAAIEFLGYKAQATIDIAANRGISVEATMDKLVIRNQDIFCLSAAKGDGGPQVSISTMMQPNHAVPEFRLPHFYISASLTMLGIKQSILASLTTQGLIFELKGVLAPGVEFDLDVVLSAQKFSVTGDIKAGVGTIDLGELGKVKVNTDVEGSLGIVASASELGIMVEVDFDFMGQELKIGKFALEAKPNVLAGMAETLAKKVESRLRDEFKDVNRWSNAVKNGVVGEVADAEKVLTKVYGKTEKEAKETFKDAKQETTQAVKTVSKTASKFGKKVKKLF